VYDASELDGDGMGSVEGFAAWVRANAPIYEWEAVFVDYAQKVDSSDKRLHGIYDIQTRVSGVFRVLASKLGVPLVIGSQITEGGKDGRDRTKGSRAWEEDAGMVIRVASDPDRDPVYVQKNRFGPMSQAAPLIWDNESLMLKEAV
jgi:hypothetical protein